MFLDRLRISGKLVLLAVIPLLAVTVLAVTVIGGRIAVATKANDTSNSIVTAGEVATLVRDMQAERLLTIGFLVGNFSSRSSVLQQEAVVDDQLAVVRSRLDSGAGSSLKSAVKALDALGELRTQSLAHNVPLNSVSAQLTDMINGLIDGVELFRSADATTAIGRQVLAMDAALRLGEANSLNLATLTQLLATPNGTLLSKYVNGLGTVDDYTSRYFQYANPSEAALYRLVQEANAARTSDQLATLGDRADLSAVQDLSLVTYYPRFTSFLGQTRYIETKLVADITKAADDQRQNAIAAAGGVGAALVVVLLLVAGLTVLVGRRVSQPLVALATSANRIATAVESELTRVSDDEAEVFEPVRLDTVDTAGRDEIGELARAFEQVQSTAARLVERQVTSRRNVATMFGHIGRRTQNLVGRQLSMIDRLERQETNSDRLANLYQLDHLSSRLNRNAGSLVVLSGSMATDQGGGPPLSLGDIVRLALGEIEDYTRVDIEIPDDIVVQPSVVADLTLMFAELMENAAAYSPPHTRVLVTAEAARSGVQVLVIDHGIGMSAQRLAEENARLSRRERLDLAPTEVLGLFVTGRLARRHGMGVALVPTAGGGVTAVIAVSEQHLVPAVYHGIAAVGEIPPALPGAQSAPADVLRVPNTAPSTTSSPTGPAVALPAGASTIFDNVALQRATLAISAGAWNAFAGSDSEAAAQPGPAAPEPAVASTVLYRSESAPMPAPPAPVAPPPPAPAVSWWDSPGTPAAPAASGAPPAALAAAAGAPPMSAPARQAPRPEHPAGPPALSSAGSGGTAPRLQRRVPGAQLPAGIASKLRPEPAVAIGDAGDPAAARALVEEFEAGVRNAQRSADTGAMPQIPPTPNRVASTPGRPAPAPAGPSWTTGGAGPTTRNEVPPATSGQSPWNPQPSAAQAFTPTAPRQVPPTAPVSPPVPTRSPVSSSPPRQGQQSPGGLVRRVPGATLSGFTNGRGGASATATPVADPDAARALIEQIEAGVSRALNMVVVDDHQHEGSPR